MKKYEEHSPKRYIHRSWKGPQNIASKYHSFSILCKHNFQFVSTENLINLLKIRQINLQTGDLWLFIVVAVVVVVVAAVVVVVVVVVKP